MTKKFFIICLIFILVASIPPPGSCNNESGLAQVLYINSYDYGDSWSRLIADGIYDSIAGMDSDIYIHTEFMDSKFISDEEYFDELFNIYSYKFSNNQPDLIIVSDDNALRLIKKYRDTLFPGIPVVFTGINDCESVLSCNNTGYTGIIEKLPIKENIEFILELHPSLETLYLVTDDSYTGKIIRRYADNISKKYEGKINIRYPVLGLTPGEMAEEITKTPGDSAVLLITYNVNTNGENYCTDDYAYALSSQHTVPIYTVTDQYNYLGVTGGCQISPFELGKAAAVLAGEILGGTDAKSIPVGIDTPYEKVLNYNQIRNFGIDEENIPAGVNILKKAGSTVTIPSGYAIAGVIFLLSLASILVVSLIYNRRLKVAKTGLKKSFGERDILMREFHHMVKNNLAITNSLITMQIMDSKEEETKQKLNEISNRIISMSIVHEKIRLSKDMIGIEARELFMNLGRELIKNYYVGVDIDFTVNGEDCLIRSDKAVPLSLVLNEIITNSLKFAFEGRKSGEIHIEYSCNDGRFTMTISDNGTGISEASIRGETDSIGLNLIYNVVAMQLHGKAKVWNESGTKWLINFPIDEN